MSVPNPHYLLFSEACHGPQGNSWRFVLENVDSERRFAATDEEPQAEGERLELLAVVRGLEAIDEPARVTLVTKSRYVSRGLKNGLGEWRSNHWQWEYFGRQVPIRDDDLWRRVDRALEFHRVECRAWQFDSSDSEALAETHASERTCREQERHQAACGLVSERKSKSLPATATHPAVKACGPPPPTARRPHHPANSRPTPKRPHGLVHWARQVGVAVDRRRHFALASGLRNLLGSCLRPLAHRLQPST